MKTFNSRLISYREFSIELKAKEMPLVKLFKKDEEIALTFLRKDGDFYYYRTEEKIVLGNEYILSVNESYAHLDLTRAVDFKNFDLDYAYLSNDLGANYHKDYTEFVLWAPLAYKVNLRLLKEDLILEMNRDEYGTYRLRVDGDFDGELYRYIVYVNDEVNEVLDPYGKSSNSNAKASAVINLDHLKDIDTCDSYLPPFTRYTEAVIYECSVRDMTIHKNSNIKNKGKYLGLTEENRVTAKGNPAGLDYLTFLNVSHVQLLPVLDFKTVDETNPNKQYNWGYDPEQMFTLEGSYSLYPNDPYSRMKEFKHLVSALHRRGIRVNLDVVYNHVYEVRNNALQKITPYYFFRHTEDYQFIEHSFCGDDFASERLMAKKMIVDSVAFLMRTYHVDGFRFDLMGLIDVKTMQEVDRIAHSINPSVMLYGEGWDMFAGNVPMAHMNNAHLLPRIAFFNDRYRNIARGNGGGAPLNEAGYLLGNENYFDGFKFVYLGSCLDVTFPRLFMNANQSVNYVECHDNATLFDSIDLTIKDTPEEILTRIKMVNKVILNSFGIPFFHAGQEIGLTKYGNGNTYNKGDKYNFFDYDLLDKRYDLALAFKNYVNLRRLNNALHEYDPEVIANMVDFERRDDCLIIKMDYKPDHKKYIFFINPTRKNLYRDFDEEYEQVMAYNQEEHRANYINVNRAMSFPLTMKLFRRKYDD